MSDSGSGSTTSGNETCDTAAGRPQWFLLVVRAKQERTVAEGLQAKGYEVFLPMHTVRRQWSDRVKTYDAPLFPGQLFCRFSSILVAGKILAVTTPGVVDEKPQPIPDLEIERLRRITTTGRVAPFFRAVFLARAGCAFEASALFCAHRRRTAS